MHPWLRFGRSPIAGTAFVVAVYLLRGAAVQDAYALQMYYTSDEDVKRSALILRTFRESRQSGDFTPVITVFQSFASSPDPETKGRAVSFLLDTCGEMTAAECRALLECYTTENPGETTRSSQWVQRVAVGLHWRLASREERRTLYLEAISNGSTPIWEGATLSRLEAVSKAAAEGADELIPEIERHAGDIDRIPLPSGARQSAFWIWVARLRAGANDRDDGMAKEAARLEAMSDSDFAALMANDSGFREAVVTVIPEACAEPSSEPCAQLIRVCRRQTARFPNGAASLPDWLREFRSRLQGS